MKEGLIKSVSEGNKTLEHRRYRDALGLLVDVFDLVVTEEKLKIYQIIPPMKGNNYTRKDAITDMVNDYSEIEMLEILRKT